MRSLLGIGYGRRIGLVSVRLAVVFFPLFSMNMNKGTLMNLDRCSSF